MIYRFSCSLNFPYLHHLSHVSKVLFPEEKGYDIFEVPKRGTATRVRGCSAPVVPADDVGDCFLNKICLCLMRSGIAGSAEKIENRYRNLYRYRCFQCKKEFFLRLDFTISISRLVHFFNFLYLSHESREKQILKMIFLVLLFWRSTEKKKSQLEVHIYIFLTIFYVYHHEYFIWSKYRIFADFQTSFLQHWNKNPQVWYGTK